MIDYIAGPFQYGFMVRALIVSVLVGVMCPVLGAYVITRGRAFMGDALAHSVLPGMVVAFLLGISPFFAAVPAGIVIALLMGAVSRRTGISEDTSIGIIFAGMFALGLVMLSRATNVNVNIEDLLLGQVLGGLADGRFRLAGADGAGAGGTLCVPQAARLHHLRPRGSRGRRDQDGHRPNTCSSRSSPWSSS